MLPIGEMTAAVPQAPHLSLIHIFMAETYWRKALEKGYDDPRAIEERIRQLKSKP